MPKSDKVEDYIKALFFGCCVMLLPFVTQIEESLNEFLEHFLKGLYKYSTKCERKAKLTSPSFIPKDIAFKFRLKTTATNAINEDYKQEVESVAATINVFQNTLKGSMLRVTEQEIVKIREDLNTSVINFLRNVMESYLIYNGHAESSNISTYQILISNVISDIYVCETSKCIFLKESHYLRLTMFRTT